MATVITVIGATGRQGGSVIDALLADGNRTSYNIRAITRNKDRDAGKKLSSRNVEVREADINDTESLKVAFAGSHVIFAVTNFFEHFGISFNVEEAMRIETAQGINIAKAAAATDTMRHYVWSTLPNARLFSGAKATIPYYDSKNKVDEFIKSDASLLQKTTFLLVGFYASNIQYPFFKPFALPGAGPQKLMQIVPSPPTVPVPMAGDEKTNVGLFVKAILEQPEKSLPGRVVTAVTGFMSVGEFLSAWAAEQKHDFQFVQVDDESYEALWPGFGGLMSKSFTYWDMLKEKSFSGGNAVLSGEDLCVTGLVDTRTVFAQMQRDA